MTEKKEFYFFDAYPALTCWAKLWRTSGARERFIPQKARDGAAVLSAQADAFAGTKAKEKVGLLRSVP
jgi:hypothetical protein